MPRKKSPPKYRLHKARNLAVVTIDGKDHYLGPYGSPESHEAYARLLADWNCRHATSSGNPGAAADRPAGPELTVNELLLAYLRFAEDYYVSDGQPTKELTCMREAIRPVRQLYGLTAARSFGPLALKQVRRHMVDSGLSRKVINRRVRQATHKLGEVREPVEHLDSRTADAAVDLQDHVKQVMQMLIASPAAMLTDSPDPVSRLSVNLDTSTIALDGEEWPCDLWVCRVVQAIRDRKGDWISSGEF